MTVLKKTNDTGRWTSVAAGIALVSMLATTPAAAESVNDIIRSLAPIAGQQPPPKPSKPRPVPYYPDPAGRPMTITIDYNYAYELVVYFPFDSAELTDFARNQLHALGMALQSPALTPYRYLIAGHTDAVGLPDYNRDLSIRRAHAVARHLVERYGIDPRRLFNTGWGATQLKDPRNPRSGVNRRVEVALVVDRSSCRFLRRRSPGRDRSSSIRRPAGDR
jgi:OmpA-OmpF porin, OOP family